MNCPCRQLYKKQNCKKITRKVQQLKPLEKNIFYAIYLNEILCETETDSTEDNKESLQSIENDLNKKWTHFWCKKGNELVLQSWIFKYKNYIDPNYKIKSLVVDSSPEEKDNEKYESETIEKIHCYCGLIDLHKLLYIFNVKINKKQLTIDTVSDDSSKFDATEEDWNILWEKHYESQYKLHYKIFLEINSSFSTIKDIEVGNRQSTCIGEQKQSDDDNIDISSTSDVDIYDSNNLELKALGLPTSFGRRRRKKHTENKTKVFEDDNLKNPYIINEGDLFDGIPVTQIKLYTDQEEDIIVKGTSQKQEDSNMIKSSFSKSGCDVGSSKHLTPPPEIVNDKNLYKYWKKRFSLFSRFDDGIKLDKESWFSVTPEKIAQHIAKRLKCSIIVDAFCGSGGNTIQFAFYCDRVIAIDIDPIKINLAKHNAKIYGVDKKIDFIVGDFLNVYHYLRADVIFLSPPWGGPQYTRNIKYDIEKDLSPLPATELLDICRKITPNISLYLPRNTDIEKLVKTAGEGNKIEIERNFLNARAIALSAYYGNLVK